MLLTACQFGGSYGEGRLEQYVGREGEDTTRWQADRVLYTIRAGHLDALFRHGMRRACMGLVQYLTREAFSPP